MIVIGGSLGGTEGVRCILAHLPADLGVPVAIALHRYPDGGDLLTEMLQRVTSLPVIEVSDKEEILPGRVYIAPANYHLLVDDGCFSLSTDGKVNFARPSIGVLFESAAAALGPRVIGVVLSGATADSAAGALAILRLGGSLIVEDPATAVCGIMPQAAIKVTGTNDIHPVAAIAAALLDRIDRRGLSSVDS